ncbi:MAG: class I SAM-dependent methyltransferase [Gemmatimonadales bacterium]|nr:class I SAM-dependent methyltransferase [Gemmatimonadales bacterium]
MRLVLRSRLARTGLEEERGRLLSFLSQRYGVDGAALGAEYRDSDFLVWFRARRAALERFQGPFRLGTTGDFGCEALYLLVRAARPRSVVDTGVLYGASSAHILAALVRNGGGELHSIEVGRDPREPPHDHFVPAELKSHWNLIIGDSRRELPSLLRRCASIDMFHHDSLHTFEHMTWEFETAFPYLKPGGVLSSDDVLNPHSLLEIFRENAFPAFCERRQVSYSTFQNLGVAVSPGTAGAGSLRDDEPQREGA